MGQGDIPASPGGLIRRRREKRQLERLAAEATREPSPFAGRAHISIVEQDATVKDQVPGAGDEPMKEAHLGGFRVHAVPIDQRFDEEDV